MKLYFHCGQIYQQWRVYGFGWRGKWFFGVSVNKDKEEYKGHIQPREMPRKKEVL